MVFFVWLVFAAPAAALDEAAIMQLGDEDGEAKLEAINKLIAAGDIAAIPIFKAMQEEALQRFNGRVVIVADGKVTDALTGAAVNAPADKLEALIVNNRIRGALEGASAALKLISPERHERLAAAKAVADDASEEMLPLIKNALEKESDAEVKALLVQARATIEIKNSDATVRRAAVKLLGETKVPQAKQILLILLQKNSDGSFGEPDAGVRDAAKKRSAPLS